MQCPLSSSGTALTRCTYIHADRTHMHIRYSKEEERKPAPLKWNLGFTGTVDQLMLVCRCWGKYQHHWGGSGGPEGPRLHLKLAAELDNVYESPQWLFFVSLKLQEQRGHGEKLSTESPGEAISDGRYSLRCNGNSRSEVGSWTDTEDLYHELGSESQKRSQEPLVKITSVAVVTSSILEMPHCVTASKDSRCGVAPPCAWWQSQGGAQKISSPKSQTLSYKIWSYTDGLWFCESVIVLCLCSLLLE